MTNACSLQLRLKLPISPYPPECYPTAISLQTHINLPAGSLSLCAHHPRFKIISGGLGTRTICFFNVLKGASSKEHNHHTNPPQV